MEVIIRIGSSVHTKVSNWPYNRYALTVMEEDNSSTMKVDSNVLHRAFEVMGLYGLLVTSDLLGAGYTIPIDSALISILRAARYLGVDRNGDDISMANYKPGECQVTQEKIVDDLCDYVVLAYNSDYVTFPGINFSIAC